MMSSSSDPALPIADNTRDAAPPFGLATTIMRLAWLLPRQGTMPVAVEENTRFLVFSSLLAKHS